MCCYIVSCEFFLIYLFENKCEVYVSSECERRQTRRCRVLLLLLLRLATTRQNSIAAAATHHKPNTMCALKSTEEEKERNYGFCIYEIFRIWTALRTPPMTKVQHICIQALCGSRRHDQDDIFRKQVGKQFALEYVWIGSVKNRRLNERLGFGLKALSLY